MTHRRKEVPVSQAKHCEYGWGMRSRAARGYKRVWSEASDLMWVMDNGQVGL